MLLSGTTLGRDFGLARPPSRVIASYQAILGIMYEWSFGVQQDYAQAFEEWYRKAAEQGHAGAGYLLGCCYWEGRGVLQNHEQALLRGFARPPNWGMPQLNSIWASCTALGGGCHRTMPRLSPEYGKAAEFGECLSPIRLGLMYHFGQGVPQDDAEAVSWYRKAAEQGHAGAANNLAVCLRERAWSSPGPLSSSRVVSQGC